MKNFILQKESDDDIQQIKVNSKQAILFGSILIFTYLSSILQMLQFFKLPSMPKYTLSNFL